MLTIQNYTISKPKLELSKADLAAARRVAVRGIRDTETILDAATTQNERRLAISMNEAFSNLLVLAGGTINSN